LTYTVSILPGAGRELARLPRGAYERVRDALRGLGDDPRPSGCRKLVGRDGWRTRVADYRVIYDIDDRAHVVTVLHVGHRRDVYR
jgi:mRNA interferase RelE/StbE